VSRVPDAESQIPSDARVLRRSGYRSAQMTSATGAPNRSRRPWQFAESSYAQSLRAQRGPTARYAYQTALSRGTPVYYHVIDRESSELTKYT